VNDTQGWEPHLWTFLAEVQKISSFVDVGCGAGLVTKFMLDRGVDARCVEASNEAIRHSLLPRACPTLTLTLTLTLSALSLHRPLTGVKEVTRRAGGCVWDYWLHWEHWDAGLTIHLTLPSIRGMFGSAGVLTHPAGCSETRHDRVLGGDHQLSQRSATQSLTLPRGCVRGRGSHHSTRLHARAVVSHGDCGRGLHGGVLGGERGERPERRVGSGLVNLKG
jgi:hypothetical protein